MLCWRILADEHLFPRESDRHECLHLLRVELSPAHKLAASIVVLLGGTGQVGQSILKIICRLFLRGILPFVKARRLKSRVGQGISLGVLHSWLRGAELAVLAAMLGSRREGYGRTRGGCEHRVCLGINNCTGNDKGQLKIYLP